MRRRAHIDTKLSPAAGPVAERNDMRMSPSIGMISGAGGRR